MKIKICEAVDLKPTDFSTRHSMMGATKNPQPIDPYIAVDVDDLHIARTTTKPKTFKPRWDEEYTAEVHSGQNLGLTVFHDAAIPPDEFVANCTVAFEDLASKPNTSDIWVSLFVYLLNYLTVFVAIMVTYSLKFVYYDDHEVLHDGVRKYVNDMSVQFAW